MFSIAFAQSTAAPATGGDSAALVGQFLPLILVFAVFYFLLIRPQQKQQKLHRQMVADAKRGDEIVTSGGIHGKVAEVGNDHVKLEIAGDVVIKLDKSHIQSIKGYQAEKKAA